MQDALSVVTEYVSIVPCSLIIHLALRRAIKAVSLEAHSVHAANPQVQIQMQTSLTRQEQVLTVTAHAMNHVMAVPTNPISQAQPSEASSALAYAGTEVVICAVHKVAADHSAAIQVTTGVVSTEFGSSMVTMQEVSSTTKTAVAEAVERTDTTASPIDVMHAAEKIIQQNTQPLPVSPLLSPGGGGLPPLVRNAHVVPSSHGAAPYGREMPMMSDYPMDAPP
jgi:hypothetical protein